mmetsp:Transcript_48259/g.134746  ORF Transcript_48259/g.134746 Transcript_48259/m.134746 type:complete len:203 (-) Transcript_48259:501-1109(-)
MLYEEAADSRRKRPEITRLEERRSCHGCDRPKHQEHMQTEGVKVLLAKAPPPPHHLAELCRLEEPKDPHRAHLLQRPQRCQADHGHLNGQRRAHEVKQRIRAVQASRVAPHDDENTCVNPDHVQHVHVPSPGGYHCKIRHASHRPQKPTVAGSQRTAPQVKCATKEAHGHALVVVRPGNGPHDVRRDHRHEHRCEDAGVGGA